MKIIRVNMGNLSIREEEFPQKYSLFGGRGLIATLALDEIPPNCAPLGPDNKLIFCIGALAGTIVSSSARLSAGGKSPLTGGIKESNSGGTAARQMFKLGVRAIIIEGRPADGDLYLLVFNKGGVEIVSAERYRGMGTYEFAEKVGEIYGKKISTVCIGPAGEQRMTAAGIFVSDTNGDPSRACGRGGLGALMGSKGIKGMVLDSRGDYKVSPSQEERFRGSVKAFNKLVMETAQTSVVFPRFGTVAALPTLNALGALPTKNFRLGSTEHVDTLAPDYMRNLIIERGGEGRTAHPCMAGCLIQCSNVYPDKDGKKLVAPIEYEGASLLGCNLGIGDYDQIGRLTRLCNDLGLDLIEMGGVLSMLMDEGKEISFGDGAAAERLLNEVRKGTILGKVIGQGVSGAAKVFGIDRVLTVKGQFLAGHDPRALKGMAVTYAFSPQGADHTVGLTLRAPVNHNSPEGQMELSRSTQITIAAFDTLGMCYFVSSAVGNRPDIMRDLLNDLYGTSYDQRILEMLGKYTILAERLFNELAGIDGTHDRLPEVLYREKLPPHDLVVDIPDEDMDRFWENSFWGDLEDKRKYFEGRSEKNEA